MQRRRRGLPLAFLAGKRLRAHYNGDRIEAFGRLARPRSVVTMPSCWPGALMASLCRILKARSDLRAVPESLRIWVEGLVSNNRDCAYRAGTLANGMEVKNPKETAIAWVKKRSETGLKR
jgi:hypothetical protein